MGARGTGAGPVWGDGFSDDAFPELARVGEWDVVSPDEYVLFFPRLGRAEGEALAAPVIAHLRSCSAALRADAAGRDGSVRSGPTRDDGPLARWLWRAGVLEGRPVDPEGEALLGQLLIELIETGRSGPPVPYDRAAAIRLAFGTGLNPGYVWTEAALSPELMLFAGWLGHLDRGRAALVPLALAEFLSELTPNDIDDLAGHPLSRLKSTLQNGALDMIRSAAKLRLDGRNPVVRLRRWRLTPPSHVRFKPRPAGSGLPVAFGSANAKLSA